MAKIASSNINYQTLFLETFNTKYENLLIGVTVSLVFFVGLYYAWIINTTFPEDLAQKPLNHQVSLIIENQSPLDAYGITCSQK